MAWSRAQPNRLMNTGIAASILWFPALLVIVMFCRVMEAPMAESLGLIAGQKYIIRYDTDEYEIAVFVGINRGFYTFTQPPNTLITVRPSSAVFIPITDRSQVKELGELRR